MRPVCPDAACTNFLVCVSGGKKKKAGGNDSVSFDDVADDDDRSLGEAGFYR